jgi:UDPglucose 6-dehydrogenase
MTPPTIGFAGLTHLGLVSGAAAAGRGFSVVAFDPDAVRIEALRRGELPVVEPGLAELGEKCADRLRYTTAIGDLAACDVLYVAADVPTDDAGASDVGPIHRLVELVEGAARPQAVLVVLSQVPPGFTRALGGGARARFYQVETLVFGRAVERALHPERIILGCADPSAPLPAALAAFLGAFECPILPMRFESAELAKIAINMCLMASVSTANTLAEICEGVGADWHEIVPALKLDRRIGPHAYLAPGLGIGGGNLERDLATVCRLADALGADAGVVRAWLANSRHRREWALMQLHARVLARVREPILAVLGLAYKEDTASTKNSPALALLAALAPYVVRVYDPVVQPRREYHPRLVAASSALEACAGADALVVMTPWAEFRRLTPADLVARLRGRAVIDPHGVLDGAACRRAGLEYVRLGTAAEGGR